MKTIFTIKGVLDIIPTIKNAVKFVENNPEVLDGITIPFHLGSQSSFKIKVSKPHYDNVLDFPHGDHTLVEVLRTDLKVPSEETVVFKILVHDLTEGAITHVRLVIGLIQAIMLPDIDPETITGCNIHQANEMVTLQVTLLHAGKVIYSHSVLTGIPISETAKQEAIALALYANSENKDVPFTQEGRIGIEHFSV